MKIGLLQCDDVADSLRDVHGNYPDMIQNLLRAVEPDVQFQVWPCYQGEFPIQMRMWTGGSRRVPNAAPTMMNRGSAT